MVSFTLLLNLLYANVFILTQPQLSSEPPQVAHHHINQPDFTNPPNIAAQFSISVYVSSRAACFRVLESEHGVLFLDGNLWTKERGFTLLDFETWMLAGMKMAMRKTLKFEAH